VLALFAKKDSVTAKDAAETLGLSDRMMRILMQQWVEDGWLTITNTSNRSRSYGLSASYRQFVGNVTETQ